MTINNSGGELGMLQLFMSCLQFDQRDISPLNFLNSLI